MYFISSSFFLFFFISCFTFSLACRASPCRAASCGCSCHFKRPAWCVRTPQYQNCRNDARHSILRPPHPASHLSLQEAAIPQVRSSRAKAEDGGRRCCSDAAPCILRPSVSTILLHAASRCRMRLQEQRGTGRFIFKVAEPWQ